MLFALLSVIFYLVASYYFILKINNPHKEIIGMSLSSQIVVFSILALFFHFFYLYPLIMVENGINLSFINPLSLAGFIVVFIMLLYSLKQQVFILGIGLLPTNAILMIILMLSTQNSNNIVSINPQSALHIFSSIVSFGIFSLALMQVIFLSLQNYVLHKHQTNKIVRKMPALFTMEHLLINMILAGVLFLSLSLLSGFLYMEDMFAQHVAHKTILSILSWFIFVIILTGHRIYGWRGRVLITLTTTGITILFIAFVGNKFILQHLIN
jgi:ABC-type uncharacterized transport system permease subunit